MLTPLAAAGGNVDRKALACKRALLVATLMLIEDELAGQPAATTIVIHEAQAEQAARMFLASPGLTAAAAMLAFSAREEV